jgi:hypothetical protein
MFTYKESMKTTVQTLPEIHISDIRTFRTCRRRWEWSSGLKRNLEPYVVYPPFFTGRGIHEALEMHYRDGEDIIAAFTNFVTVERALMESQGTLWPQEENTFEDQVSLSFNILAHYRAWQAQDDKKYSDKNLEFIKLEYPFNVPLVLPSGHTTVRLRIAGRFDGLVYNRLTQEYWIWETKSTRSASELINTLSNDEQSALYLYAAQKVFKKPIAGVLYNILRKKVPVHPRLLQNGLLSKAAIDTTAFMYLADIKAQYPDWSDETIQEFFGDILASLAENEQKYFLRWPVYKSPLQIRNVMDGVYATAKEMLNPRTVLYPAPGFMSCNFCLFKSPCLTRDMGGDYEVLLNEEYRTRVQQETETEVKDD